MNLNQAMLFLFLLTIPLSVVRAADELAVTPPLHDVSGILKASKWGNRPVAERRDVIALKTYEGASSLEDSHESAALLRELVRQAFLISGRDMLGLATRDQTLGERVFEITADPEKKLSEARGAIQIVSSVPGTLPNVTGLKITLFRENPNGPITVWEKSFPMNSSPVSVLLDVSRILEELSRTEFVKVLDETGYTGAPNRFVESGEVPAEVVEAETDWNMTPQYFAIRTLHKQIREQGESPERLAALAMSYARLGSLVRFHFSSAADAFQARALLYSQRLVALTKDSLLARRTRAYALGLVGNHQATKEDLNEIMGRDVRITDDQIVMYEFCEFKNAKLEEHTVDPKLRPLVRYFKFLAAAPTQNPVHGIPIAEALIADHPDCFAAYDFLADLLPIEEKAPAAHAAQVAFFNSNPVRLSSQQDLPDDVKGLSGLIEPATSEDFDLTDQSAQFAELVAALRSAGKVENDLAEPSYACLGQLLSECAFAQAERTLYQWRVHYVRDPDSMAEIFKAVRPLIEGHRLAEGVMSYVRTTADNQIKVPEFLESLDLTERVRPLFRMAFYLNGVHPPAWHALMVPAARHLSPVYHDQCVRVLSGAGWGGETATSILMPISPHSPTGAVGSIRYFWKWKDTRLAAGRFETQFADNGDVLNELAQRFIEDKDLASAARLLSKVVEIEQSATAYEQLAKLYEAQENWDDWLKTMKASLELTEDANLAHSEIRAAIAKHLMSRGDYAGALPYAEASAQVGFASAMMIACRCHEMLGDVEKAEAWIKRLSFRFNDGAIEWYFWCRSNAKGDLQGARKRAEQAIASAGAGTLPVTLKQHIPIYKLLEGKHQEAFQLFNAAYEKDKDPIDGLFAVHLAGILKDAESQNRLLLEMFQQGTGPATAKNRPGLVKLAAIFLRTLLDKAQPLALDRELVDRLIIDHSPAETVSLNYFVGMWLAQQGKLEDATLYLKAAAQSSDYKLTRHLAAAYLHENAIDF